jgi:hypothetical protein
MAWSRRLNLSQRLTITTPKHGDTMTTLSGDSNTSDRRHDPDRDLAAVNKVGDVGQAGKIDRGVLSVWTLVYAAGWFATDRLGATFHGSNSSMRRMG